MCSNNDAGITTNWTEYCACCGKEFVANRAEPVYCPKCVTERNKLLSASKRKKDQSNK